MTSWSSIANSINMVDPYEKADREINKAKDRLFK
jgi:hypothetical protein